ncbi:zinc-binding dehydrogenase [Candidatus Sumerlaeota bacterium]|nr:zinc-binding dehydrogenase [Candidatus Sumerlaeota bacterium]
MVWECHSRTRRHARWVREWGFPHHQRVFINHGELALKVRAALSDGKGSFLFDEIELGDPGPGEVMVRLHASGVCHTDWDTMNRTDHIVLGHEGAGMVERVGEGVAHVAAGDRVVLNWAIPCGECFQCGLGNETLCETRVTVGEGRFRYRGQPIVPSFRLGTMVEATVVPAAAAVRIPDDIEIPFPSASILGCGVMTGVGSVLNAAHVPEGASVVVLGCGGVGLSVIQGARIAGAERIIAIDLSEGRLEMARRFGATHAVQSTRDDADLSQAAERVRGMTDGRGADFAFECVAIHALAAAPLRMIRHGGMAVGCSGIESTVPIDMKLFEWDKTYINPLYGQCRPQRDFPRLLRLYGEGHLMLDEMVTRTYPLERLGDAYDDMHAGRNAKGVLLL